MPCARRISFSVFGIKVDLDIDTEYSSSDISRSIEDSKEWSIRPNGNNAEVSSLVATLSAISMGDMDADANLYAQFAADAQRVLSGETTDPIRAIVVPLASVKAVSNLFVDNPV